MRKADRLFKIVEYLKARKSVVKAQELADHLEVCLRTIYRDIADLVSSGVPIISETGVGYILDKDYIIKPLMFTIEEIEALAMGAQMVRSLNERGLEKDISGAINRLISSLPDSLRSHYNSTQMLARRMPGENTIDVNLSSLRLAIRNKNFILIRYRDLKGEMSRRLLRPLSLIYFGSVWILLSWCEKRQDFRNFRIDRIEELIRMNKQYRDQRGKRFEDYCDLHGYSKTIG